MRIVILILVVAAAGAAAFFLLDTDDGGQAPVADGGGGDTTDSDEVRPELTGAADGTVADAPSAARTGTGEIVGVVQLGGKPAPARVELRLVSQVESSAPGAGMAGVMNNWIDRILDAGMAAGRPDATFAARADGAFRFDRLTAGFYEVRARDDDGRQGVATATLPAQGARVAVTVELPSGEISLRGRVVRADEKPFHGWVVVQPAAQSSGPFMVATGATGPVDADGRFNVSGLMPGDVIVSAFQPGELRAMGAPLRLPHDGEYTLTIGADGGVIAGKVIAADTNEPIAGATVIGGAGDPRSGLTIRSAVTGSDGRFSLAVGQGNGGMFVRAEGYVAPPVQLSGGAEEEVVVTMTPVARIKGRVVVKGSGEGVGGIAVVAVPADTGMGGFASVSTTFADAEGNFELNDVSPLSGAAAVYAIGKGYASPGMQNTEESTGALVVTVEAGQTLERDLEVVEAGHVRGRVNAGGKPVVGAVLTVIAEDMGIDLAQFGMGADSGFGSAVTDAEGRYVFDSIFPDKSFQLVVRAVDHPTHRSEAFKLASGSNHELDITLESARWLDLEVVSSEGDAPLAGVIVSAASQQGDANWRSLGRTWNTGPDGHVRVGPIPAGLVAVQLETAGHVKERNWKEIEGSDSDGDVKGRIVLAKGLVISGTVIVPEGARVNATELTVQSVNFRGGSWVWERAPVREDGTFSVDVLPTGTFKVEAELKWKGMTWKAEEKIAAGTTNARLILEERKGGSGHLVIKVLDADGNAIASGSYTVRQQYQNGSGTHSSSFSGGTFSADVNQPGTTVWIEIYRVPGGRVAATVAGPFDESSGEIEIRLDVPTTIEGAVRDAQGAAVVGARVTAKPIIPTSDGFDYGSTHASTATGEDGRYVLKGLSGGAYRVEVKAPDAYQSPNPVDTTGGSKRVDFSLRAGLTAAITVLDARGAPVQGASVSLTTNDDAELETAVSSGGNIVVSGPSHFNGKTGTDGIVQIKRLSGDARYDLHVFSVEEQGLLPKRIDRWTPGDTTVQLEQAYRISGVIRDAAGNPVEGARAYFIMREDTEQSAPTEKDGKFVISGLSKSSGRLLAGVDASWIDTSKEHPGEIKADAGATGVVLTVDPGLALAFKIKGWDGEGWVHATLTTGGRPQTWKQIDGDGRVVFRGLKSGERYVLRIMALTGGHYVHLKDLEAGGGEILVTPIKGKTISGRLQLPSDLPADLSAGNFVVQIQGEFYMRGQVHADGTFELEGVPDGTWTLVVNAQHQNQIYKYRGTVEAKAGDEGVLIEVVKAKQ